MQRDFEHYFPCIREASSPLNTWYKKYKCYFKSRQNEFVEALMYFDPEIEKAQQLLALGVSPNTKDPTGNTGLIYASDCGRLDIARMMLDAGADVNATNCYGETALIMASWRNHRNIIALLLLSRAHVDAQDEDGDSALMFATAVHQNFDAAQMLLDADADVNAQNNEEESPLSVTHRYGYDAIWRKTFKMYAKK